MRAWGIIMSKSIRSTHVGGIISEAALFKIRDANVASQWLAAFAIFDVSVVSTSKLK